MHRLIITSILVLNLLNPCVSQSSGYQYCDSILRLEGMDSSSFHQVIATLFNLNYYESDSVAELYHRARSRALDQGRLKLVATIEIQMADMFHELGLPDSCQHYANTAARSLRELGEELAYARTANIRRLALSKKGDHLNAYKICFEALEIFERYDDKTGIAISNRDIGSIKMLEQKYDEALAYCLKGVHGLLEAENWYELTFSYQRIAIAHRNLKNYEEAHKYINLAIRACRRLAGFRIAQGLSKKYWTKGYIYQAEKQYQTALSYYDSAQIFGSSIQYSDVERFVHNSKGSVYLEQRKYAKALAEFEKSIALSKAANIQLQAYDYYLPVYENLVEAYEGLEEYAKANELIKIVTTAKDSIFKLESQQQIAELQTKYETAQKVALIEQLEQDKTIQRNLIWFGSILLGLLSLLAIILFRNNRFRAKTNQILRTQKEEIQDKNEQNELLLREIHHRVKNNLQILSSLLTLQADYLKDTNALDAINEGRNRVQSMAFIHQQLYAVDNVTSVNMKAYLADLCGHLSDSFHDANKKIEIRYNIEVDKFDVETAIPLGLIVNELITNSMKYAFVDQNQGSVKVDLWQDNEDQLCLQVADDGEGLSSSETNTRSASFGTDLVEILSKKLRGQIEIKTQPGYSTKIKFKRFTVLA